MVFDFIDLKFYILSTSFKINSYNQETVSVGSFESGFKYITFRLVY